MIPKKYRFSLRSDPHFFEKASKLFFEFGVVFYIKNDVSQESSQNRSTDTQSLITVAGIVPKKKWTKASQRNHHKRLLRAALTNVCQTYESSQQIKLVAYLNKNPQSVKKLTESLSRLVSKL